MLPSALRNPLCSTRLHVNNPCRGSGSSFLLLQGCRQENWYRYIVTILYEACWLTNADTACRSLSYWRIQRTYVPAYFLYTLYINRNIIFFHAILTPLHSVHQPLTLSGYNHIITPLWRVERLEFSAVTINASRTHALRRNMGLYRNWLANSVEQ